MEELVKEPCSVAEMECENPAGWGSAGGYATNRRLIKIPRCEECGEPVCEKCSQVVDHKGETKRMCNYCVRSLINDSDQYER